MSKPRRRKVVLDLTRKQENALRDLCVKTLLRSRPGPLAIHAADRLLDALDAKEPVT